MPGCVGAPRPTWSLRSSPVRVGWGAFASTSCPRDDAGRESGGPLSCPSVSVRPTQCMGPASQPLRPRSHALPAGPAASRVPSCAHRGQPTRSPPAVSCQAAAALPTRVTFSHTRGAAALVHPMARTSTLPVWSAAPLHPILGPPRSLLGTCQFG